MLQRQTAEWWTKPNKYPALDNSHARQARPPPARFVHRPKAIPPPPHPHPPHTHTHKILHALLVSGSPVHGIFPALSETTRLYSRVATDLTWTAVNTTLNVTAKGYDVFERSNVHVQAHTPVTLTTMLRDFCQPRHANMEKLPPMTRRPFAVHYSLTTLSLVAI